MPRTIDQLILNSPYQEPAEYWSYNREKREFIRKQGRRPAGYRAPPEVVPWFGMDAYTPAETLGSEPLGSGPAVMECGSLLVPSGAEGLPP